MKQIRHTGTLVYYDGVQVFEGQDEAGVRYIGMLADSANSSDSYVVVEVSSERMQRFHTGAPDLKALLVEEARDGWYLADVRDGFAGPLALQEQSGADVETNLTEEDDFVLGVLSYMLVQQRRSYLPIDSRALEFCLGTFERINYWDTTRASRRSLHRGRSYERDKRFFLG